MSFRDENYVLAESQNLEFKEASGQIPDDLWETYSAFANTEGGEIVLGVREDKATHEFVLSGVTDPKAMVDDFWNTVRNPSKVNRDVMLLDGVAIVSRKGMDFICIEVPRAERDDKPVMVYERRAKSFVAWIRRGSGDFRASDEDLRLMSYDNEPSADRRPLVRFGLDAFCQDTINRYRNAFNVSTPGSPWVGDSQEDFLYHIGAISKDSKGELHPTQAGLLAFGHEYEITNLLPQYLLDYREELSGDNRWDDRVVSQSGDWSGNVVDFYLMVTQKMQRHFKKPFNTDEYGTRHGSNNPVTEAVNEAVTNALVHAYYGATATIRVVLKEDSVEVTNSGSFLMDREVAIAGGYSEARNPTLLRLFSFIGASDRAGSGLQQMWRTWENIYGTHPQLTESHGPAVVRILMPFETGILVHKPVPDKTGERKELILRLVESRPGGVTAQVVQSTLGVSQRVAQKGLKDLFEAGAIDRVKDGRTFVYTRIS